MGDEKQRNNEKDVAVFHYISYTYLYHQCF